MFIVKRNKIWLKCIRMHRKLRRNESNRNHSIVGKIEKIKYDVTTIVLGM